MKTSLLSLLSCLIFATRLFAVDIVKTDGVTHVLAVPTASQFKSANSIPNGTPTTITLNGTTSGTLSVTVPAITVTRGLKLPADKGTNGYVLSTDGGTPEVTQWVPQTGSTGTLTVGTTTIAGGTDTKVLFNNGGFVGEYAISGTGSVVMTSRTVNGHALSSNVTVTPADLSLVIGVNVQASSAVLSAIDALGFPAGPGYLAIDDLGAFQYSLFGANWPAALTADLDANVAIWLHDPTAANFSSAVTDGLVFTSATALTTLQAATYATDAGSTDAYFVNLTTGAPYVIGVHYRFRANTANSGAATVNFNSVGAKPIKYAGNGGVTADLVTGDILAGQWVELVYDGNNFLMVSPSARTFLTSASAVTSLAGTANQVTVSATTGAVTVSLPTTITGLTSISSTGFTGALTGNASTATAWATGRTLSITGDMAYTSPSITGTGNVTAAGTLATVNSNVGSFTNSSITVNAKGLVTAASNGATPVTASSTDTLTNKRITARVTTITSSATPTVNTDSCDAVTITALAADITSMTSSLSGTPSNFDMLFYRIKDDGTARAITWGASFVARGSALPTTTVISKVLYVLFVWNSVTSTWDCLSVAQES